MRVGDTDPDHLWRRALEAIWDGRIRVTFVASAGEADLDEVVGLLNQNTALLRDITGHIASYPDRLYTAPTWDERSFFAALTESGGSEGAAVADAILGWARDRGLVIGWGGEGGVGQFSPSVEGESERYAPATIRTDGTVRFNIAALQRTALFASGPRHAELMSRARRIIEQGSGLAAGEELTLDQMADPSVLVRFIEALDWVVDTVQSA